MTLHFPAGPVSTAGFPQSGPLRTTIGSCVVCSIEDGAVHPYCLLAYELNDAAEAIRAATPKLFDRYEDQHAGGARVLVEDWIVTWDWVNADVQVQIRVSGRPVAICTDERLTAEQQRAVEAWVLDARAV